MSADRPVEEHRPARRLEAAVGAQRPSRPPPRRDRRRPRRPRPRWRRAAGGRAARRPRPRRGRRAFAERVERRRGDAAGRHRPRRPAQPAQAPSGRRRQGCPHQHPRAAPARRRPPPARPTGRPAPVPPGATVITPERCHAGGASAAGSAGPVDHHDVDAAVEVGQAIAGRRRERGDVGQLGARCRARSSRAPRAARQYRGQLVDLGPQRPGRPDPAGRQIEHRAGAGIVGDRAVGAA